MPLMQSSKALPDVTNSICFSYSILTSYHWLLVVFLYLLVFSKNDDSSCYQHRNRDSFDFMIILPVDKNIKPVVTRTKPVDKNDDSTNHINHTNPHINYLLWIRIEVTRRHQINLFCHYDTHVKLYLVYLGGAELVCAILYVLELVWTAITSYHQKAMMIYDDVTWCFTCWVFDGNWWGIW